MRYTRSAHSPLTVGRLPARTSRAHTWQHTTRPAANRQRSHQTAASRAGRQSFPRPPLGALPSTQSMDAGRASECDTMRCSGAAVMEDRGPPAPLSKSTHTAGQLLSRCDLRRASQKTAPARGTGRRRGTDRQGYLIPMNGR